MSSEPNNSTPPGKDGPPRQNPLVQAEKLMQIAFVLPCAMLIGWGVGWFIDHHFGTHWATVAGLIFGIVAGMVSVIRTAISTMNSISTRKPR